MHCGIAGKLAPTTGLSSYPSSSLQIQLPANGQGKSAEDGPGIWTPTTPKGNADEILAPALHLAQHWHLQTSAE